jgi:hypothetical protein
MSEAKMQSGYAFRKRGKKKNWESCSDEKWEIEVYGPTGDEVPVGERLIDGHPHVVFACKDGKFRAQLRHMVL